jgi:hypothetical protein
MASMTLAGACLAAVALGGLQADAQAPQSAVPTFTKDVAPILYKNCVGCHRPGDIGPMSLLSYDQARPYAKAIHARVSDGSMPPWHAEAPIGTFKNDRRLSPTEVETIEEWVAGGSPQGNPKDMPSPPVFETGWSIGKPDVVLTMATAFDVPASGEVPYRYFELPTNFTEDKWVQAIELRPGARSVVHHILAFARDPKAAAPGARQADYTPRNPVATPPGGAAGAAGRGALAGGGAAAAGRGAQGPINLGGNRGALIATTAPGTNAQVFPPGQAILIKAGSVISFQMHYTASGTAVSDKSSIGFVFAKEPVKQEIKSSAFVNTTFAIPAGAANHRIDSAIEFNVDAKILALFPHTHVRGKQWEYRMVYPDGRSEVVLSVPRYDFNWQTYYEFATPLAVPKGARIEAVAHYDNSSANRANPDPSIIVRWGEQTWEEMQYTGITYVVDGAAPTSGQQ